MNNFKEFLDAVARSEKCNALYIVKTYAEVKPAVQQLLDEAYARGLDPMIVPARHMVVFRNAVMRIRNAFPELGERCAGMQWTAVYGLDELNGLENAEAIKGLIQSQIGGAR